MSDHLSDSDSGAVLQFKLEAPRQPSSIVDRPRLRNALAALDPVRLVLLVAPPGYGKTTLLAQWHQALCSASQKVCWLTLDEGDQDPKQFLKGLIIAMGSADIDLGDLENQAERGLQEHSSERIVRNLCTVLARDETPVTVFLDDYHRAAGAPLDRLLVNILSMLPSHVRFLISSRLRPEFGVSQMLATGQAYEFSSDMLRFTNVESRDVLAPFLAGGDLSAFVEQIDGWPVALQLARVLSSQEKFSLESLAKLTARGGHLSTYLTEQILKGLPDTSVQFLLETSILDRFNVEITDTVRDRNDSWTILESLAPLQSFITPLDAKGVWFRYHHLFSDYLRGQLVQRQPAAVAVLHRRASIAFERSAQLVEAVRHAGEAKDFERCAQLIEAAGGWRLVLFGGMAQLNQLLGFVPFAERLSHPRLLVADAYLALKEGDFGRARSTFGLVATFDAANTIQWDSLSDLDRDALAVGVLIKTYQDNDIDAQYFELFRKTRESLGEADGLVRGVLECAGAVGALALGKFDEAEALARDAMTAMRSVNSMLGLNYCFLHAGLACLYKGKVRTAEAYLAQARDMASENFGADSGLKAMSDTLLSQVAIWRTGNVGDGVAGVEESFQHIFNYDGWFDVYAAALDTRFHMASRLEDAAAMEAVIADGTALSQSRGLKRLGAVVDAQRTLKACILHNHGQAHMTANVLAEQYPIGCWRADAAKWRPYQDVAYALCLWSLQSDAPRARALACDVVECARTLGARPFEARGLILHALISTRWNDPVAAMAYLREAVSLSYVDGYIRPFVEHRQLAPLMASLRRQLWQEGTHALQAQFLSQVVEELSASSSGPNAENGGLSVREHDVMEELTSGLTNKEIARSLDMTEHTVKFHLKNIFSKLGVDRRAHALSAFQEGKKGPPFGNR